MMTKTGIVTKCGKFRMSIVKFCELHDIIIAIGHISYISTYFYLFQCQKNYNICEI